MHFSYVSCVGVLWACPGLTVAKRADAPTSSRLLGEVVAGQMMIRVLGPVLSPAHFAGVLLDLSQRTKKVMGENRVCVYFFCSGTHFKMPCSLTKSRGYLKGRMAQSITDPLPC